MTNNTDNKNEFVNLIDLKGLSHFWDRTKSYIDSLGNQIVTYSELKSLKNSNRLVPGNKYRITDYTAAKCSLLSWMSVAGNKFDIIVEALNENTLSEDAKAINSMVINDENEELIISGFPFDMSVNKWSAPTTSYSQWSNIAQYITELSHEFANVETDTQSIGQALFSDKFYRKGRIEIKIEWVSGTKKIHILGAVLQENNDGPIISHDFHLGYAGNNPINNTYILNAPESKNYTLKLYVDKIGRIENEPLDSSCKIYAIQPAVIDYFQHCNLEAWEIKYCFDHDRSRFNWGTVSAIDDSYKGIIYYMKDEFNNEAPYDFKNIKFDGYYTFSWTASKLDGTVASNRIWNNKIEPCIYELEDENYGNYMMLKKCYFNNHKNTGLCINNIIKGNYDNITFGDNCTYNNIEGRCSNISFGDNSSFNNIGVYCSYIQTGNYFQSNIIGKTNSYIYCGDYYIRNNIGDSVKYLKFIDQNTNELLNGVQCCTIGDQCGGSSSNSFMNIIYTGETYNASYGNYIKYHNIPPGGTSDIIITDKNKSEPTIYINNKEYKLSDAFVSSGGTSNETVTNDEISNIFSKS
jgi:hypothetical protein